MNSGLAQDLRYALRAFRRSPGFACTALAALALGIGANTAIFSVVNAVLLRPLPYPHAERMVQILASTPSGPYAATSIPRFEAYRALSDALEDVAAFDWQDGSAWNLDDGYRPEAIRGERVSRDYFALFGVPFMAGRAFTPSEDSPGGGRVAVVSSGLWRRRFGDRALIGKTILLGGDSYTVIGIAAFVADPPVDVWLPLQADPSSSDQSLLVHAAARLRPGVTIDQARTALGMAAHDFRRKFPDAMGPLTTFTAEPLARSITGDVRPALLVLLGAVGCVLLMACANVANLLLARGAGRTREMAIRAASGASRARIIRQLLTESVTLSMAGGALGLLFAVAGVRGLLALNPGNLPRIGPDSDAAFLDARVLAVALLLSIVTGVLFGLLPAFQASRTDLQTALKDGARSGTRGGNRMGSSIIVAEMALAFVLLSSAGLLIRTFLALQKVSPGFDPHHVLTLQSALNGTRFDSTAAIAAAVARAEDGIAEIPGVQGVAASPSLPLESSIGMAFRIAGRPLQGRNYHGNGWWRYVTPSYFDVYRIPILRGRAFTARDTASAPPVALISRTTARRYWPGGNPIGERIRLDDGDPHSTEPYREIIGVVGDVQEQGLDQESGESTYVPLAQVTDSMMAIVRRIGPLTWSVRTGVAPLSIAAAVEREVQISTGLAADRVRDMDQVLAGSTARSRFNTVLLAIFAAAAILLASIGLYGLMAYAIGQRTREFGVRLALGADPSDLRNRIAGQAVTLAVAGIIMGVLAALAMSRWIAGLLYGVDANDPLVFAGAAAVLLAFALVAGFVPARRAARLDPMAALLTE